jgi:hypothetical protein
VTRRLAGLAFVASLLLGCPEEPAAPAPPTSPPVPDAGIPGIYEALTDGDTKAEERALATVEAAQDRRFIPVLMELLRAGQLGVAGRAGYNQRLITLERLSGESFGADWFAWADWYAKKDLSPPPGFATWKGSLWSRVDPRFGELIDDDHPTRIRVEEIGWGGVEFDGIPTLDAPAHVSAAAASWLGDGAPVVGVSAGGATRAYPLRIIDWHELVNDTLGDVPLTLAYCTLCGSAVAYDTRTQNGEPRRFLTSGLLYRSNKLMLDRETQTLWSQLTGRPVLGPLAAREIELPLLPAVVTRWADWRKRHPKTTVLSLETGHVRLYAPGMPYGPYFQSLNKMFPAPETRDELATKQRVFGLVYEGVAKAWPMERLTEARVTNDRIGRSRVVLIAAEGSVEVDGQGPDGVRVRYEAGGPVRAYLRGAREFSLGPDEDTLRDATGAVWRVEEEILVGPDQVRTERLPGTLAYWFAWQAFHPDTAVDVPEEE